MIDLHSHVLAGIDDGPPDLEGSLALVRAAAADGTRTIAATPHLRHDFPAVRPQEIAGRCADLNAAIPPELGVEVVPGAEIDVLWAQSASPEDLRLASYGGRGTDLLLESPYGPLTGAFEEMVFRITLLGFRVLLAHPERNPSFQRDPGRLTELVRRGVLVQLTAQSLTRSGKRSHKLAVSLVEGGLAHVIASDAHRAQEIRSPVLSDAVRATARMGPGRGQWMVTEAPAAILAGEPLPAPPAGSAPRRGLLRRRART